MLGPSSHGEGERGGEPAVGVPYVMWDGAGNTFHFVAAEDLPTVLPTCGDAQGEGLLPPPSARRDPGPALARALCSGGPTIPRADGLLLLEGERARFWNRDGSPAAFCGNGARCLAAHALARTGRERVCIVLQEFEVEGWREGEEIVVGVPSPRESGRLDPSDFSAELGGLSAFVAEMARIEAGVPHLCLLLKREAPSWRGMRVERRAQEAPSVREELATIGAALRSHARFRPAGVNVDFIRAGERATASAGLDPAACGSAGLEPFHLETFERGLEALSPACGSGALAAACLLLRNAPEGSSTIRVASGALLRVQRKGPAWYLQGPARPVAKGVFVWSYPEA